MRRTRVRPGLTTPPARVVYRRLRAGFERARAARPEAVRESRLRLAGRHVRLRVVGPRLARTLNGPLAHLRAEVASPDPAALAASPDPAALTIDIWEETETGIGWEGGEWVEDLTLPAAIDHSADGRLVSHRKANSWIAFERSQGHVVGWVGDGRRLSQYELGRPLFPQLLLWHSDRKVVPVHAGLVSRDGRGVLLAGDAGSGKSTTALLALRAGLRYLGDDTVGIEEVGKGFLGHSFFGSTKLEPEQLALFPALAPRAIPGRRPGERKLLVLLSELWPGRLRASAPVKAIALLRVGRGPDTRIRPASATEAFAHLVPSSLPLIPPAALRAALDRFGRLVGSLPAYRVELGEKLERIPARLIELLDPGSRSRPRQRHPTSAARSSAASRATCPSIHR